MTKTICHLLVASLLLLFFSRATAQPPPVLPASAATTRQLSQPYLVTEVIDGDTIKISSGETVRLIGVDTPETVHPTKPVEAFGLQASAFTKRLLQGKQVRLEFDQDTRDRYKRLLAYAYLPNGTCANEQIILAGYGYAYTQFPFKYMERYRELEKTARTQRKGLWADEHTAAAPGSPVPATPAAPVPAQGLVPSSAAPVTVAQGLVAITPTGKKYHSMSCRTVAPSTARQIPLRQAAASGYTPCKLCK